MEIIPRLFCALVGVERQQSGMGFQDREYFRDRDEPTPTEQILKGMNSFFSWSFRLFTVPKFVPGIFGIEVRVHIFYILIAAWELAASFGKDSWGPAYAGAMLATLFVFVLLHEFGHCLACRWVGGDADKILMWPLGGLAFCRAPHRWKSALVTTVGGPAVNVILVPILGAVLLAAGAQWSDVIFNPLSPNAVYRGDFLASREMGRVWLWSAYYTNLVLLLFNVLVPMFPMDGGRIFQELLWGGIGYKRSMQIAIVVGYCSAAVMALLGIASANSRLVCLAIFGAGTCYTERQKLRQIEDTSEWGFDTEKGYQGFDNDDSDRMKAAAAERQAARDHAKQMVKEREKQQKVDAILDKIQRFGIQSLSERDKAILKSETDRKRGER